MARELEQKHKDAQALAHGDKVKGLEAERDGLKNRILELSLEKNTFNEALVEAQPAVLSKAQLLSTANDAIKDLNLKLEGLEGALEEAKTREGALTQCLAEEKQLRANEAANLKDQVDGEKHWVGRLVAVANRITEQLANMKMSDVKYAPEPNLSPNAGLTIFFESVLRALERLHSNRASSLADEARMLCQGAMTKVLTKLVHWNPNLDFDASLDSLPGDMDLAVLEERIEPVLSRISMIQRLEGQRQD